MDELKPQDTAEARSEASAPALPNIDDRRLPEEPRGIEPATAPTDQQTASEPATKAASGVAQNGGSGREPPLADPEATTYWCLEYLVTADEVIEALPPNWALVCEAKAIAGVVSQGIKAAVDFFLVDKDIVLRGQPAARATREIAATARDLMAQLDIPLDAACDFTGTKPLPRVLDIRPLKMLRHAGTVTDHVPLELRRKLRGVAALEPKASSMMGQGRAFQELAVDMTPRVLALIALLADMKAEAFGAVTRRGPRRDNARLLLFESLADAFLQAFGRAPPSGRLDKDPGRQTAGWVRKLIEKGADRLPKASPLPETKMEIRTCQAWLADTAKLKDRPILDALAEGVTRVNRRKSAPPEVLTEVLT